MRVTRHSLAGGGLAVAGECGWRGELAGEVTTVGALGVELGFGAFGACAFGVGEGASGVDLGLVVCLEGIASRAASSRARPVSCKRRGSSSWRHRRR